MKNKMKYIKSPLNYTGGKYKLLSSLFEIFPKEISTFVDLFAGGFNVGINVTANTIICNDHITYLIDLYKFLQEHPTEDVIKSIKERIYELDLTKQNASGYIFLRDRYNANKDILDFLILTFYSFNHQIRFNNNHQFNTSFGKNRSSYNVSIEKNLIAFCNTLKTKNIIFYNNDFLDVNLCNLGSNDFVYCDPPYLISTGVYNDGKRGFKDWTEVEEQQLLELLDKLNAQGVKFALSNVLYHQGLSNDILIEWSKKHKVYYLDKTYSNCNYHLKNKDSVTIEVVITNFNKEGCLS